MPALIFVLFAVVAGAIIWLSYAAKKKRREDLQRTAARLGLAYSQADQWSIDERYPFHLFQMGEGRGCENVMTGTWKDLNVTECDYWYYTTSTDSDGHTSRSYSHFSCVLTEIPAACPHLTLSRETLFTRLADRLSFHDIEFESEEFNKTWQVKSSDPKFANDVIDQRMMKWLMYAGTGWAWEVSGATLLTYAKRMKPSEIPSLLQCAKGFREHLPKVVYDLYPKN